MKLVNKYIPFFKVGVHQSIAYKTNWLFIIVGNILNCFVSFYLWKAIFDSNKSKSFLGFSLEEMIVYIFVTFITKTMIGSDVTDEIGQEIKDGSIAIRLLKPISYNTTFIYKEIGEKVINLALLFVTIIVGVEIYRYRMSGLIQLSIERLLFFVISVVLSYFINVFLNITYGFTAFFFKNLW